jgi:hypothetical protein
MERANVLSRLDATPWREFAQPEWNQPDSIAKALVKVVEAESAASCSAAYDSLLYAVGNNHAGTYYPVLLAIMPVLESILSENAHWPQRAVLSALDDLFASFQPEPSHEQFSHPQLGPQSVAAAFQAQVHALGPAVERIAQENGLNSSLAREFLSSLGEDDD